MSERSSLHLPYRRRLLLALGALLPAAGPLPAAPRERRVVRVVGSQFARIFERTADGAYTGLGVDVARQVLAEMGCEARIDIYPWKRAQAMVAQGQADLLVGPYKSAERLAVMAFTEHAFYQDQIVFYGRVQGPPAWNGALASLQGKRVAVINGWAYGEVFEAVRPRMQVSVTNTVESGLNMLAHSHVDLFAANRRNVAPVLLAMGLRGMLVELAPAIDVQRAYFAFPQLPAHDELRRAFDRTLGQLLARGELHKLARRYDLTLP
ncbi:substrate-binding periplasmic protein [Oxalobacteraceae bacterium A2-2]